MKKILFKNLFIFTILFASKSFAQIPVFPSIAANPAVPVFNANDVSYLNKDTAVSVGNNGMSWMSIDGGLNWSVIPTFTSTTNNNSVIMMKNYICVAGDAGTVTFSNDRGATWANAAPAQPLINYHGVHFADSTFGAAVGDNGDALIYHWVGGLGWIHIASTQIDKFNAVATYKTSTSVFTDGNAIAVGDNGIISTYAFGSWTNLTPPTAKHINGVYLFSDNVTVLAVGQFGLIMRSPDFGNTWTTLNNSGHTLRDISPGLSPTQFLAVGDSGTIYVSNDGGNTFVENTVGFNTTNLKGVSTKDPKGAFAGSGNVLRVFAQDTVNLTYANKTVLCPGEMFKTAIDLRGIYGSSNLVSLELSDSSGSFASPVTIGSKLNPLMIDSITGAIPVNAKPSVLYQLRASSSDPSVSSNAYITTFTVHPKPLTQTVTVNTNFVDLYVHSQAGCTYQWYHNAVIMSGQTDTIVTTIGNGNYYVVITGSNGCTTTTNTFNYTTTFIKNNVATQISVSPNPAGNSFYVNVPENATGKTMNIFNMLGKKIDSGKLKTGPNHYNSAELEAGIYFITIENFTTKIVIVK